MASCKIKDKIYIDEQVHKCVFVGLRINNKFAFMHGTEYKVHIVYCSICTPLHRLVLPQWARSEQEQTDTMQHPIRPACRTGHSNFGGL